MRIDPDEFRRYYASLSNAALLDLDRSSLIDAAKQLYDDEIASRKLNTLEEDDDAEPEEDSEGWSDASSACSFTSYPGDDSASKVSEARTTLTAAGIPCRVETRTVDAALAPTIAHVEYNLVVPSKFNLQAMSVLDKEIFNAELEADWAVHFQALSDEDLRLADPESLVAGLLDRVERLNRIYREELVARGLEPSGSPE